MLGTIVAIGVLCVASYVAWDVYQMKKPNASKTMGKILDAEAIDLMNEAVRDVQSKLDKIRNVTDYEEAIEALKEKLSDLRLRRDEIMAANNRNQINIEHKVGLLKQQHEQELALSKRDAVLTVREENLTKDQQRFADQMEFERKQMSGEMESLRTLTAQLLERLPDVKAIIRNG